MWTITKYELIRMLRTKTIIAVLIITPLVLIFILGSALQDLFQLKDKPLEPVTLAIYDADQGEISEMFRTFLQEKSIQAMVIPLEVTSKSDVVDKVNAGEVNMGLYIPQGFNQQVMQGKQATWEIISGKDREQNVTGHMIIDSFLNEVNRVQAVILTLGPGAAKALQDEVHKADNAEKQNTQSTVQLTRIAGEKEQSAIQYYAATMLIMFLLNAGVAAAISLLNEKENHTLSRLKAMPFSSTYIMMGKIFGHGLLACIQAAILIVVTKFVYGVYWGHSFSHLIIICLLTIFISMCLALTVSCLFNSTKQLGGVFGTFIGIMTFLSGGMSPNDGTFLESVKPYTINYWAADGIQKLMGDSTSAMVQTNLLVLTGMSIAFLLIALGTFQKVGYHE